MRVVGIDAGLRGSVVLLVDGAIARKTVMPVIDIKKGKSLKHEYDIPAIAKLLRELAPECVFIEKQQAMPLQGGVSMFSIGLGYGILRGVTVGLGLSHYIVHAKTWQGVMFKDCAKTDTKAMAAIICGRLWPLEDFRATDRSKKVHDGHCDASLIAKYGAWVLGQE